MLGKHAGMMMLCLCMLLFLPFDVTAQNTPNARQARGIFDKAFNHVFHSDGCTFDYDVNLVGIYKCRGQLWLSGKMSRYKEQRLEAWNDGTHTYRVDHKRREVELHNTNSPKKDKYTAKFKFNPDEYDYHVADGGSTFLLTLKLRKDGKSTIKQVKVVLTKRGLVPLKLSAKVYFFWCHLKMANFTSERIAPSFFDFPRSRFRAYKFIDKRPD